LLYHQENIALGMLIAPAVAWGLRLHLSLNDLEFLPQQGCELFLVKDSGWHNL
jgi:hypothetical protein